MISVEEARNIVRFHSRTFGDVQVPFEDSVGRILSIDISADRDFPPFNRAAMDGIVVRWDDFQQGCRKFNIIGEQWAGSPSVTLHEKDSCMEIMTGAVVPAGTSLVIRYEDVSITKGVATVDDISPQEWTNIHRKGIDAQKGDVLIPFGKVLNIGDIGILASVGQSLVTVKALPKVAVISTGDELVDVNEQPLPHQIRKSNSHTIGVLLSQLGMTCQRFHFNDNEEEIRTGLAGIIENFDVILMSGGVSKGKRDFVPEILEEQGVRKHFHRVAQRPGKPFWFGSNEQVTVFGFPGNPVSTLVCFQVYFREWLAACLGTDLPTMKAKLSQTVHFKPDLTYFVPVKLTFEGNELMATPYQGHGSGDLSNLTNVDGFVELPADREMFRNGEVFDFQRLTE